MNNHDLIQAAFNNSGHGIVVIDQDRIIRLFNPAMERLTEYSSEQAVGSKCYDILGPKSYQSSDMCHNKCPLSNDIESEMHFEGMIGTRCGNTVDVGINYTLTRLFDGQKILVMNVQDTAKLAEIEDLRASLLAGVSHELQTPIAIIKAYASTLSRADIKWDRNTIKEKLKTIEEESDRLSTIVAKLLFTSRLDAGVVKLNRMTVDLGKEALRVTNKLAVTTDIHQLEVNFPEHFPLVHADPEKIEEVFVNLIENAIKFSPYGGSIHIIGNNTRNDVLVSVADSGVGIHPDDGEKLFQKFYRSEENSGPFSQGTGLGLYICRSLIEAHGGKISVEGVPGQGTCFTFSLPKHKVQKRLKSKTSKESE